MKTLSTLSLLILLAVVNLKAETAPNLAKNPGFEEWKKKPQSGNNWSAKDFNVNIKGRGKNSRSGCSYRSGEGELDTERHSGKYAQYLQTTTWGRGLNSRGIRVQAGHKYRISVWSKLLSGKFQFGVCFAHKPWTYIGNWIYGTPDGKWTKYSKEIMIPKNCSSVSAIMFIQKGIGYFDDFEVVDLGRAESVGNTDDKLKLREGKLVSSISGKRAAVFNEPEFPSESPRSVKWYEKTLKKAGVKVSLLSCNEICNPQKFSRDKFDILIFPTGGFFPSKTGISVERFLAKGGTVIIDESMLVRTSPIPGEIRKQNAALKKRFLKGEQMTDYMEFCLKNVLSPRTNVFEYATGEKRWVPTPAKFQAYDFPCQQRYFSGFHLGTWPNYCSNATVYARPFDVRLSKNPELKTIMSGLPDTIEADSKLSSLKGAYRMVKGTCGGFGAGKIDELACDLLLCLYKFPKVSSKKYPAFPEAGKNSKDMDADFYILRYHNYDKEGGTLVHFGNAGAKLLRGNQGEKVLIETLKLAESELPGECPVEFVINANKLRKAYSDYNATSLEYRYLISESATATVYEKRDTQFQALQKELLNEQNRFQLRSKRYDYLTKLLHKKEQGFVYGNRARAKLAEELVNATVKLNTKIVKLRQELSFIKRPDKNIAIQYPYLDHIYFGVDSIYGRGPVGIEGLRKALNKRGLIYEGYHANCYRFDFSIRKSTFKSWFSSARFDPNSRQAKPAKNFWFKDKADEYKWQEAYRWQLERVQRDPETIGIFGLCERSMDWSLWGERTRKLFLQYLKDKYRTIDSLNRIYSSSYKAFENIQLPLTRPGSRAEHALWEDWTRFREVYRRDRELKPMLETLEKYAPQKLFMAHCTYNQHGKFPANGINFYEYGKLLKVNGFEHSNREGKEFLTYDIVSAHSRNLTSEWGGTYYPPGYQQDKVDLLSEALWKGIVNGQIGWSLFIFSQIGQSSSGNFFDVMNLPLPLGSQLALLNDKFKYLDHIILDGERTEPQIRIVYSPTTRRHTSWPGIETDLSFRAASGLYQFFKNAHIHARAIDEQAVWENHLPKQCRLLIIPDVIYQNDKMYEHVLEYLKQGGNVLVTVNSGKFNQYGERKDTWLTLAGVIPVAAKTKVISLENGKKYFSSSHNDLATGLKLLFPETGKVLLSYQDGVAALTETSIGKGKLFVCGVSLGQDCHDQWGGAPNTPLALLQPVLNASGIVQNTKISDPMIMIRPWQYKKQRFLFLADRDRKVLKKYELAVLGSWSIRDYLLGIPIKTKYDGEYTYMTGAINSPGGVVLELTRVGKQEVKPAEQAQKKVNTALPVSHGTVKKQVSLDEDHPFIGRIWGKDDKTKLGDFDFSIDVETGGGWGGKTYLTIIYGKEKLRELCQQGKTVNFFFSDRKITVQCEKVVSVYPVNLKCRITVSPIKIQVSACRLIEEKFHGQNSLVLSNGLLKVRILPKLGGRVIEFISLPDGRNHLVCNPDLITQGTGANWTNFGGIEENGGGFPGPYWNAAFKPKILKNSPTEVAVQLRMEHPVKWAYGYAVPKNGFNRLEKTFVLKNGVSRLDVKLKVYNQQSSEAPTGIRIHPAWRIGGDSGPEDRWIVVNEKGNVLNLKYPFKFTRPATKGWTALLDETKRTAVIIGFDPMITKALYTCSSGNDYTLELFSTVKPVAAGKFLKYNYYLACMRGLSGLAAYKNGLSVNINLDHEEALRFRVELGAIYEFSGKLVVSIVHNQKTIKQLSAEKIDSQPGMTVTKKYCWKHAGIPDGTYKINATVYNASGREVLRFERPFQIAETQIKSLVGRLSGYETRIVALRKAYADKIHSGNDDEELKYMIFRASIMLEELKAMISKNETGKIAEIENKLVKLLDLPSVKKKGKK